MQHVSLCLCSLLSATNQFSIPIGQKMQLTGWENANNVRNATCAASKTSKVPTQDALLFISYSMQVVRLEASQHSSVVNERFYWIFRYIIQMTQLLGYYGVPDCPTSPQKAENYAIIMICLRNIKHFLCWYHG